MSDCSPISGTSQGNEMTHQVVFLYPNNETLTLRAVHFHIPFTTLVRAITFAHSVLLQAKEICFPRGPRQPSTWCQLMWISRSSHREPEQEGVSWSTPAASWDCCWRPLLQRALPTHLSKSLYSSSSRGKNEAGALLLLSLQGLCVTAVNGGQRLQTISYASHQGMLCECG